MPRKWKLVGSLRGQGTIAPGTRLEGTADYSLGIEQEIHTKGGIGHPETVTHGRCRVAIDGRLSKVTSKGLVSAVGPYALVLADGQEVEFSLVKDLRDGAGAITVTAPADFDMGPL